MEFIIIKYAALILAFLIAIIGHEIMHGLMARYYGDLTATKEGRLSINPIKHIDPFGSIVFPLVLFLSQKLMGVANPIVFGWAKPVPVNMFTVVNRGGYIGAFNVSIAGVVYNMTLALLASSVLWMFDRPQSYFELFIYLFLAYIIIVNVILAVFNMVPIPPLDGANAIKYLSLHFKWYKIVEFFNKIEPYGMIILMIFLFTPLGDFIFKPAYYLIDILLR
ncbi:MAG: site-2 protease family protein [Nautiliaceae bacterium]